MFFPKAASDIMTLAMMLLTHGNRAIDDKRACNLPTTVTKSHFFVIVICLAGQWYHLLDQDYVDVRKTCQMEAEQITNLENAPRHCEK
jgi:hypothetical protein